MRKVFLDELPRKIDHGKQCIDWELCLDKDIQFIYNNINGYMTVINYDVKNRKLFVKYKDNIKQINVNRFINGNIGRIINYITIDFKIKTNTKINDYNRNLLITEREYRNRTVKNKTYVEKWYKYKCNVCGWTEGWIVENEVFQGTGCSCCTGKVVVEGINDIPTTAPWMVKYFQGGYDEAKLYTYSSNIKIYPICPDCGEIKNKPITINNIHKIHSIGCVCSDGISYPEKIMINILQQLKVTFEKERMFKWCRFKKYMNDAKTSFGRYDFVIENLKLIIEMDGGLGHGKTVYNNSVISVEESLYNDKNKDLLAYKNGYSVIRINCDSSEINYIQANLLDSRLSSYFDLSVIDWIECERYALRNISKDVCEYKNQHSDCKPSDIAIYFNIGASQVRRYLKFGNKIGWCHYNAIDAMIESNRNNAKRNEKKVEIIKDGVSLGVFDSATKLSRDSQKLFDVYLHKTSIQNVLHNRKLQYKGFKFIYVY